MAFFNFSKKKILHVKGSEVEVIFSNSEFNYINSATGKNVNVPTYDKGTFNSDIALFRNLHHEELTKLGAISDLNKYYELLEKKLKTILGKERFEIYLNFVKYEMSHNINILDAIHKEKKNPSLSFEEFEELTLELLSQIIEKHLMEPVGDIILEGQPKVRIEIHVINSRYGADYSAMIDTMSQDDTMVLMLSGAFLMGQVYLPYKYLGTFDREYLKREVFDLFNFFINQVTGLYAKEDKLREQLKKTFGKEKMPYYGRSLVLFELFLQLFTYGRATFLSKSNIDFAVYNYQKINDLIGYIDRISKSRKAKYLYDEKFSRNSDTGEYFLGFLMCHIIGMAKLNNKNPNATLIVSNGSNREEVKIQKIGPYLISKGLIYVENLRDDRLNKLYNGNLMQELSVDLGNISDFRDFIKLYCASCNSLHIRPFMTLNFYNTMMKQPRS